MQVVILVHRRGQLAHCKSRAMYLQALTDPFEPAFHIVETSVWGHSGTNVQWPHKLGGSGCGTVGRARSKRLHCRSAYLVHEFDYSTPSIAPYLLKRRAVCPSNLKGWGLVRISAMADFFAGSGLLQSFKKIVPNLQDCEPEHPDIVP